MSQGSTPEIAVTGRAGATAFHARGAGPAIVLLHGVGMNKAFWAPQVADFERDHRVVACDLLGHGDSAPPPAGAELADYGNAVLGLLDHLGIGTAAVIGHSMGALVAIDIALRQPRRVSRLVALNAVYRRTAAQRAAVVARAAALADGGPGGGVASTLARWFGPDQSGDLKTRAAVVRRWLQGADAEGYARAYRVFATADTTFAGRLGGLAMPALFVTGAEDPNSTPAMSRRMAAEAPCGEVLVVAGQRHMMSFAAPELVTPLLRSFLTRPLDAGAAAANPDADQRKGGEA